MNRKILFLIFGIILVGLASAEASFCCEKTKTGAWCQNALEGECDPEFQIAPTSCDSTSYCKLGCCYDSVEGTCMKNTPQITCSDSDGIWEDSASCDVPQCEYGCCLIGDQAAFVPKQRCKNLASVYGLDINFRTDISNEIQCILSIPSDVKGACVYEEEFQTTCKVLTKAECLNLKSTNLSFHEDYLCTAPELDTICSRTEKTTCVEGRDEVFFLDSCGNIANIYDSSKAKEQNYWTKIISKADSCGNGASNADSASCGNCDYFLGSTCREYERGIDSRSPTYGDNLCRDLSCEYEGVKYQHGESWCADSKGISQSLPGSRAFRLLCYDSEVLVEECQDKRMEICLQSDIEGFKTAGCRANRYIDCTAQGDSDDCLNNDKRDCQWLSETGNCVPLYAPGFDFWSGDTTAANTCAAVSESCTITYVKKQGKKECADNCQCESENWAISKRQICQSLGDCGVKVNYVGVQGYNTQDTA